MTSDCEPIYGPYDFSLPAYEYIRDEYHEWLKENPSYTDDDETRDVFLEDRCFQCDHDKKWYLDRELNLDIFEQHDVRVCDDNADDWLEVLSDYETGDNREHSTLYAGKHFSGLWL